MIAVHTTIQTAVSQCLKGDKLSFKLLSLIKWIQTEWGEVGGGAGLQHSYQDLLIHKMSVKVQINKSIDDKNH